MVGDVPDHHAAGADDHIAADGHAGADLHAGADPHIIAHMDGPGVLQALVAPRRVDGVARGVMLAISAIAAFLARDPDSSVFRVVSFAWAGFGAAFGPVMLMALFWKRSNKWGALAGMLVGGIMVFVWKFLTAPLGGVWAIYELLPAFLCSLVVIVVVSLLTPAPEKSVVQVFEEVRQK